jgi:hypothetical protein
MERDGLSLKEAQRTVKRLDEDRSRWSRQLYGIETGDPSLYDLVLHIKKLSVEDAVDIIAHTVNLKRFQTTSESQSLMDDLVLAAQVKTTIIDLKPEVEVSARSGMVTIRFEARSRREVEMVEEMEDVVRKIPGLKDLKIEMRPSINFSE